MQNLKNAFGVKHPFYIITTYEEWRVIWPNEDGTSFLEQEITNAPPIRDDNFSVIGQDEMPPIASLNESSGDDVHHPSVIEQPKVGGNVSSVCATKSMNFANPETAKTLCFFLRKMADSPCIVPKDFKSSERKYLIVESSQVYWGKLDQDQLNMNETLVSKQMQRYWLLKDFKAGRDGRVWLACDSNGFLVVLKFFSKDFELKKINDECNRWILLNQCNACVKTIVSRNVLVMPYTKPVSEQEYEDPAIKDLILKRIHFFIRQGWVHNDFKRAHVGLLKRNEEMDVVFFDLTDVREVRNGVNEVGDMLAELQLE